MEFGEVTASFSGSFHVDKDVFAAEIYYIHLSKGFAMKTLFIGLLMAATAGASGAPIERSLDAEIAVRAKDQPLQQRLLSAPPKPNEIRRKNTVYSGIAVQIVKTRNPLQLINPLTTNI